MIPRTIPLVADERELERSNYREAYHCRTHSPQRETGREQLKRDGIFTAMLCILFEEPDYSRTHAFQITVDTLLRVC